MKALIIGGGIGGLVTGLELNKIGIEAHVFESVSEVKPLGVGINLLPHCVRCLDNLGAMDRLLALGIPTDEQALYTNLGQKVWSEPRGLKAGYQWPQIAIHRGELQVALMDHARATLPSGQIHTGHHLKEFRTLADGRVAAKFVDRHSGASLGEVDGDFLIGADGIHSVVRASFFPEEGPPRWNGAIIWRSASHAKPFLTGRTQLGIGGRQTFICYPMSKREEDRGSGLINWAARFFVDMSKGFAREDWNREGRLEDFLPRYENWRFDFLDVPELIAKAEKVWEFPMVDRDPLPRWTHGRATLLGDAAHPMYPLGSNGASQAILDARALAQAILDLGDIDAALARYESERRSRTADIVLRNRSGGPEVVIRMAEERAPDGFANIEDVIPRDELERISKTYKELAKFDVQSVNA
jgi:2-polyprenyl-6-methoxyphenol hydroxylase-like FAD-dependent oxidoreductase